MRLRLTLLAVLTALAPAAFVHAEEAHVDTAYFVQLGSASSEDDAREKWEQLKTDFPDQLGKLHFATQLVRPVGGGPGEYRLQAGPAGSRDAARRICTQLTVKGVECFIVETASFHGEPSLPAATVSATPTELAQEAPVSVSSEPSVAGTPPPSPPEVKPAAGTALTPVTETPPPAPPSSPPSPPAGHVEVSEAVPVAPGEAVPQPASAHNGWVRISGFASEQAAFDFYGTLHDRFGDAIGRHLRVMRSLSGQGQHRAVLSVGLVRDEHTATAVCAAATAQDASLSCNMREEEHADHVAPKEEAAPSSQPSAIASNEATPAAPNSPFAVAKPPKYWVSLGAWKSRAAALAHYKAVERKTGKLLAAYSPDVATPPSGLDEKRGLRLRVGAFDTQAAANALCSKLHKRGVSCLVVPE